MKYHILSVCEIIAGQEITAIEAGSLKKVIADKLVDQPIDCLILNMSGLRYIDSSGLGVLVSTFKLMKERGGMVKLYGLGPQVQSVLDVTCMSAVFEVLDELPPPDDPDAGVPARRRPPKPSDSFEMPVDEAG